MGSLINAFKTMFSPAEAKALYTDTMSGQDKVKIKSAMEAIDSSRRKEVSEVTQSIVYCRYCPTGREKIVQAIAAKNLSVDDWREVVSQANYATYGLHDGEDLAKILLAIAALPPEKRPFCKNAFFNEKMPAEDRLAIVNAFGSIRSLEELEEARGLTYGLESGKDIALVLKAVSEIPEDPYM